MVKKFKDYSNTNDDKNKDIENNEKDLYKCPDCDCEKFIKDEKRGEKSCKNCGLVIEDNIKDKGKDWRSYSFEEEQEKSRTGDPISINKYDKGLSTSIKNRDYDSKGNLLNSEKRNTMSRLRRLNKMTEDNKEKNLRFALGEIERMGNALGVSNNAIQMTSKIYREALEQDLIRGRSIEEVISACLYISLINQKEPRSMGEIVEVSRIKDEKKVFKTKKSLSSNLDDEKLDDININTIPVSPKEYIPRFISKIDIKNKNDVERLSFKLYDIISEESSLISGKSPNGLAGSLIYISIQIINGNGTTQKDISDIAGVSSVTIRNQYKDLKDYLKQNKEELNLDENFNIKNFDL